MPDDAAEDLKQFQAVVFTPADCHRDRQADHQDPRNSRWSLCSICFRKLQTGEWRGQR